MFHFARAFKQSGRRAAARYLIWCRVRRTMELLAGTDLPISEVAASGRLFGSKPLRAALPRTRVGVYALAFIDGWRAEIGREGRYSASATHHGPQTSSNNVTSSVQI